MIDAWFENRRALVASLDGETFVLMLNKEDLNLFESALTNYIEDLEKHCEDEKADSADLFIGIIRRLLRK